MSNEVAENATQQSEELMSPIDQPLQQVQGMLVEAEADRKRIKSSPWLDDGHRHIEAHGTILGYLLRLFALLIVVLVRVREMWWLAAGMQQWADVTADHLEALEERTTMLEDFGLSTTIMQDDAELIQEALQGGGLAAAKLLQGPFPLAPPDGEAQKALSELITRVDVARKIVERGRMNAEDLDDDDDDEEDDGPQPEDDVSSPGGIS